MKTFRSTYAFIALVIILAIVLFAVRESKKPAEEQVSVQGIRDGLSQKQKVDPTKIQQVRAAFPKGFPLPEDAQITTVAISAPVSIGGIEDNGRYQLSYEISEETPKIIQTYTTALEAQGLKVFSMSSDPGEQTITGNKVKKNGAGVEVVEDTYEIGVNIMNLAGGNKRVNLWLNL